MEQKQICCGSVYNQIPPLSPKHVWFVAQNLKADDQVQIFYNALSPLCHYRCRIPELLGKRIRGCFFGWVVLSSYADEVMWSLWNPITSKVIYLPPLVHKEQSDPDSDNYDRIGKCCLSSPPDDPNSILLMTRSKKPNFVFCRLYPEKNKLRWKEVSYAKQAKIATNRVTDDAVFLYYLICCNGKVYAYLDDHIVEVSIVVKDPEVAINLLPLLRVPVPNQNFVEQRIEYLVGSSTDILYILVDYDEITETISFVYLFKLNINTNTWEELEDLKDATISLVNRCYSHAVTSELGGYIHIVAGNQRITSSYHIKDKTFFSSFLPCSVGISHVFAWTMLECNRLSSGNGSSKYFQSLAYVISLLIAPVRLLEVDHKQEEDNNNKIVVSKVKSDGVDINGLTGESHLLNLPFDLLNMIMESSVGVEYMKFRASCKLCYLAAPVIQWRDKTTSKKPQLQAYSLVSPWLMVIEQRTVTLFDPMFGDKYIIKTPPELGLIGQLRIHCSRYGWLLMRKCCQGPLILFNPFTNDTHELPQDLYLDSFGLSAPPTSPDCMVAGFTRYYQQIYIHFVGQESSWRTFDISYGDHDPYYYRFPVFYGGDIYAWGNEKGLDVFTELGEGGFTRDCVLKDDPISCCTSDARFLVKCDHKYKCDQHFTLVIVGEYGESVEIFMPNEDAGKWEKVDDIGRHMIYIGDKTSLCMEAKTPEMENKIYFPRLRSGNIVFYSLKTRKFHTSNDKIIQESFGDLSGTMNHLYNVWIEPSWS